MNTKVALLSGRIAWHVRGERRPAPVFGRRARAPASARLLHPGLLLQLLAEQVEELAGHVLEGLVVEVELLGLFPGEADGVALVPAGERERALAVVGGAPLLPVEGDLAVEGEVFGRGGAGV